MKKTSNNLIVLICLFGLVAVFGCAAIPDILTPCYLPFSLADEPHPQFLPWDSLFDAKFVMAHLDFKKGLLEGSIYSSEQFKQKIFSPTGPVGMLLPTSLTGILALMAGGKYIKSPREKELETKVNGKAQTINN